MVVRLDDLIWWTIMVFDCYCGVRRTMMMTQGLITKAAISPAGSLWYAEHVILDSCN